VASEVGVPDLAIAKALAEFKVLPALPALWRRRGQGRRQLPLVDDYGHHPAEMKAPSPPHARFPGRRLMLVSSRTAIRAPATVSRILSVC